MKKVITFLLYLSVTHSYSSTNIISDFDDTIKRSNIVDRGGSTVGNVPLYRKVYIGMPSLLKSMEKNMGGLYILSASPSIISPLIKKTLKSFKIPYEEVFTRRLRDIGNDNKKVNYKIKKIESVIKSNDDAQVILIGDDIEADHLVYEQVKSIYPQKVKDIYIRKVKNRNLSSSINGFFSAFDIALVEYKKKRMSYVQVKRIGEEILKLDMKKFYRIIPRYAYCPKSKKEFLKIRDSKIKSLSNLVQSKITKGCRLRSKKPNFY